MSTLTASATAPQPLLDALQGQTLTLQQISLRLAQGVMAAYDAYNNGSNNTPVLSGYGQITPIYAWETDPNIDPFASAVAGAHTPEHLARQTAAYCVPPVSTGTPSAGSQLFGFTAVADDNSHNILVLRGTVTMEEAGYDLLGWGKNTPCLLPSGGGTQTTYGNVNSYLYDFYVKDDDGFVTSLAKSLLSAVQAAEQANPGANWFAGAHSLGGPLLTLGVLDMVASNAIASKYKPLMFTFGGLHLGDEAFAQAFTDAVGISARYANLCDFVPSMVSLAPGTPTDPYVHVGIPGTFVWQTWDDWGNHSMECIYLQMMQNDTYWDLVQFAPRTYPQ